MARSKWMLNSLNHATLSVLGLGLLVQSLGAQAAPFDPVVELFRFGAGDRLLIDRGGPVDSLGDVNGDGLDDAIVGSGVGSVRVVFGPTNGNNGVLNGAQLTGFSGFTISHDSENISYVSAAGDLNNDGLNDVLVGSLGGTHVIFGSRERFPVIFDVSALNGRNGFSIDTSVSSVSNAGDVNGDGLDDIILGNANATVNNLSGVGLAYVLYGKNTGFDARIAAEDIAGVNGFAVIGAQQQDRIGYSVGAAGDFNHDGIDDVAIGSPGNGPFGTPSDYPGEIYILFGGQFTGTAEINRTDLNGANGVRVRGIRGGVVPIQDGEAIWGDLAGVSIDGVGDLNGDGMDDLAIGASHTIINARRKGVGQTYIIFGSQSAFPARLSLNDLDGANGFRINGIGTVDYFGVYTRGADDFNDDGINDIIVGASGEGSTYIIYGRDYGIARIGSPGTPAFNATPGQMLGAARIMGENLTPLAFNELADPTGPNPLPEGTITELNNPNAAGYINPNLFEPVAVLRPNQQPVQVAVTPETELVPTPEPEETTETTAEAPTETPQPPNAPNDEQTAELTPTLDINNGEGTIDNGSVPVIDPVDESSGIIGSDLDQALAQGNSSIRVGGALGVELYCLLLLLAYTKVLSFYKLRLQGLMVRH